MYMMRTHEGGPGAVPGLSEQEVAMPKASENYWLQVTSKRELLS